MARSVIARNLLATVTGFIRRFWPLSKTEEDILDEQRARPAPKTNRGDRSN